MRRRTSRRTRRDGLSMTWRRVRRHCYFWFRIGMALAEPSLIKSATALPDQHTFAVRGSSPLLPALLASSTASAWRRAGRAGGETTSHQNKAA